MWLTIVLLAAAAGQNGAPDPSPAVAAVFTDYYWVQPELSIFTPDEFRDGQHELPAVSRNGRHMLPLVPLRPNTRKPSCASLEPSRWRRVTTTIYMDGTALVEAAEATPTYPTALRCP